MFEMIQDQYSPGSLPDPKFYILIKTTNLTKMFSNSEVGVSASLMIV